MANYPEKPPLLATRLFFAYCDEALQEEIHGDLVERFHDHIDKYGLKKARRNYWLNVIKFCRWHTLKRRRSNQLNSNHIAMLRNHLVIALRSALKHKGYSLINILGLVLGLTSFILISLYVQHHLAFDKFHDNADRIHRISMGKYAITPNALAPLVEQNFADELEAVVRGLNVRSRTLTRDDNSFLSDAFYVDKDFLSMFSFPVLVGDKENALVDQNSLVLTRAEAFKMFDRLDVVGEYLSVEGETHRITAVIEDLPANSSLQFDCLVPIYAMPFARKPAWNNASYFTFIQLTNGVDPNQFQKKFNAKVNEVTGSKSEEESFPMHQLSSIHLQKEGKFQYEMFSVTEGRYIYIFSAVAVFILLIAGVNYVNLSTSRSLDRAREVGIRKVTGAVKVELVRQFLGESGLFIMCSLVLSVGLTALLLDSFNQLAGVHLSLAQLFNPESLLMLLAIGVIVTFLAGIYPALILSRFRPVQVLKGNFSRSGSGSRLRKVLVVFQFVISAFLFTATLVISQQFDYMMDKDLGMRKDQVLTFSLPDEIEENFQTFKAELLNNPSIVGATVTNNNPLAVGASHAYRKNAQEDFKTIHYLSADEDLVEVMEMELLSGIGFDEVMTPFDQESPSFILNETAVRELGLRVEEAVGQTVDVVGKVAPIQAVVKDFHFAPMTEKIGPIVIINDPNKYYRALVKIRSQDIASTLDYIEEQVKAVAPEASFNYRFLSDSFENMYSKTNRLKLIFQLFSNLAVVIACLGMLALIAFMAQNRSKEIGIRKVLGASFANILMLLTGDFVKLVALALLIALPLGGYAMNDWLRTYAYRVELGGGLFVMVTLAALAITLLTISFQAIKTARVNPAGILRSE